MRLAIDFLGCVGGWGTWHRYCRTDNGATLRRHAEVAFVVRVAEVSVAHASLAAEGLASAEQLPDEVGTGFGVVVVVLEGSAEPGGAQDGGGGDGRLGWRVEVKGRKG